MRSLWGKWFASKDLHCLHYNVRFFSSYAAYCTGCSALARYFRP
jgi:hypothetical protein